MNRRNFLGMMVGGLAATAAVRTFPFLVFSFPKEVKPLNVAPLAPKEIIELWKQRLELIKRFGDDAGGEWWMHPAQLAALKEIGFGYPRIEIRKMGEGPWPYSSPDLYPSSTLFDLPIKECPFFRPDAKPVLMAFPFDRFLAGGARTMEELELLYGIRCNDEIVHAVADVLQKNIDDIEDHLRKLVPHMPNLYPLRPKRPRDPFPNTPRFQRT